MDSNNDFFLSDFSTHNGTSVIATLGGYFLDYEPETIIKKLQEMHIFNVRINLSKYESEEDILYLKNKLVSIIKLAPNQFNIMLDLPTPYEKIRFLLADNKVFQDVKKGDKLKISLSSSYYEENVLYVLSANTHLLNDRYEGEKIIYADGECELLVTMKNKDYIIVEVKNDSRIYTKKALNFNNSVIDSYHLIYSNRYTELLRAVKPWAVAFSFISTKQDVLDMNRYLTDINVKTELISKIETLDAVKNIKEILSVSNIMLARGDLCINIPIEDFYDTQKYILEKAMNANRKVYVATGILNSLSTLSIPSRAEITDISFILKYKPSGIILNFSLVHSSSIDKATEIIRCIERK